MAEKPKPKAKAKRKGKFTDKAQSQRFIEAARELGIEETDKQLDAALLKVIAHKEEMPTDADRKSP